MNLQELQAKFQAVALQGRFTRTQFEKFQLGGVRADEGDITVIASHNYKCLSPYGPN